MLLSLLHLTWMERPHRRNPTRPHSAVPPLEVAGVGCRMKEKSTLININKQRGLAAKSPITSVSNPPLIVHAAVSTALKTLQSREGREGVAP